MLLTIQIIWLYQFGFHDTLKIWGFTTEDLAVLANWPNLYVEL
jgi:hypothetical protein